jgi:hypothetical protein
MKFFILNGVRRALASREDGRRTVPAILYREGRKPEFLPRMRLAKLFSSKVTVPRDHRFLSIVPPIRDAIQVEFLGRRGQPRSVPLAKVRLV